MKSLQIKDVESNGYQFSLTPIAASDSSPTAIFQLKSDDAYNFQFHYLRNSKKDEPSFSEAKARLQEMQIVVQSKEVDPEKPPAPTTIPDIQEMFHKVVNLIDSKREQVKSKLEKFKKKEKDILTLKEKVGKLKFDLRWNLEMGDCEIGFFDSDGKSRGALKVNNSTQVNQMMNKFIETENLLVNTKLGLATQVQDGEAQLDELRQKVRILEEKLGKAEATKYDAEEKYIKAKMEFAEIAMKYNDLEIKNFNLQSQLKK